jgi:hypothetical protein
MTRSDLYKTGNATLVIATIDFSHPAIKKSSGVRVFASKRQQEV